MALKIICKEITVLGFIKLYAIFLEFALKFSLTLNYVLIAALFLEPRANFRARLIGLDNIEPSTVRGLCS